MAVGRELVWGLRAVSREVDAWHVRARSIPDVWIREDALDSIAHKRAHADGAALFWILPRRRHPTLLALLVAYQTMWDFLDNVSERGAHAGHANGEMLHRALVDGLDPARPISEYYRHHPHDGDGGYLPALVRACREVCCELPAFERVRPLVLAEAARCAIQSLNHDPEPESRDAALKAWAERECELEPESCDTTPGMWVERGMRPAGCEAPSKTGAEYEPVGGREPPGRGEPLGRGELRWFEHSAAASASLVPHVLLALASEAACAPADIDDALAAYMPWASLATAMLDSYADRVEDAAGGDHSYIAHYGEAERVARLAEIIARAASEVASLRDGRRHTIIVACIAALYLSKDSVRIPAERAPCGELVRSGGSLSRLLLPVLRAWRIVHGQRAT